MRERPSQRSAPPAHRGLLVSHLRWSRPPSAVRPPLRSPSVPPVIGTTVNVTLWPVDLTSMIAQDATMVTSNLPFQEWTEVLGSERLTGALLDRLTHHVYIPEMNGDSTVSNRSAANARHPPKAELCPAERAAGEKDRVRYAPAPLLPRNLNNLTSNSFAPPQWPGSTPPLTTPNHERKKPSIRPSPMPSKPLLPTTLPHGSTTVDTGHSSSSVALKLHKT